MPETRWQNGWEGHRDSNLRDLIDAHGSVLGCVTRLGTGDWRGWVLRSPSSPRGGQIVSAYRDHPDETTARAWVEAEVARRGSGMGGADGA